MGPVGLTSEHVCWYQGMYACFVFARARRSGRQTHVSKVLVCGLEGFPAWKRRARGWGGGGYESLFRTIGVLIWCLV